MSAGVLFSLYDRHGFDDLMIKEESLDNDFMYTDIIGAIDCESTSDHFDKRERARKTGESLEMDFYSGGRDGLHEEDQLYAVYEPEDVKKLIQRLKTIT